MFLENQKFSLSRNIFYFLIFIYSTAAFANSDDFVIISNRSLVTPADTLCKKFEKYGLSIGGHCWVIDETTKEFSDGSTFTQFNVNIYGAKALVILPSFKKNADHFMEGLLKIRTAKSLGARKVIAYFEDDLTDFELFLISKAGADATLKSSKINKKIQKVFGLRNLYRSLTNSLHHKMASNLFLPNLKNVILFSRDQNDLPNKINDLLEGNIYHDTSKLKKAIKAKQCADNCVVVVVSQWSIGRGNQNFLSDLELIYDLKYKNGSNPHVVFVTPYLPYARGDKVDHQGTTVSGRLIADLIESVEPDLTLFARLHAAQSQGFFRTPTIHIHGRKTINAELEKLRLDAIISPDAGFQKEASRYAKDLGLPVYVLNKERDLETGESRIHTFGDIALKGLNVAIIDDETASGGTLHIAAEFLKSQGASKVYSVVTHLNGTASKAIEDQSIDHIFVTNSVEPELHENNKITVLDISEELVQNLIEFTGKVPCAQLLGGAH